MCLNFSQDATTALQQGEWPVKAYKILTWDFNGHLLSPYHSDFEWRPGVNKSDRPSVDIHEGQNYGLREVKHGIHVFLSREVAERAVSTEQVVVELICQREHLVGAGSDNGSAIKSAVFTEVTVTEEEYARAIEAAGKLRPRRREDDWDDDDEEEDDEYDDWEDDEYDDWEDDEYDDWEDDEYDDWEELIRSSDD